MGLLPETFDTSIFYRIGVATCVYFLLNVLILMELCSFLPVIIFTTIALVLIVCYHLESPCSKTYTSKCLMNVISCAVPVLVVVMVLVILLFGITLWCPNLQYFIMTLSAFTFAATWRLALFT